MSDVIGLKGYWYEDNDYCEITDVVDNAAGVYEFTSLTDGHTWIGFIDDWRMGD